MCDYRRDHLLWEDRGTRIFGIEYASRIVCRQKASKVVEGQEASRDEGGLESYRDVGEQEASSVAVGVGDLKLGMRTGGFKCWKNRK